MGISQQQARELRPGQRVEVDYHGERHVVTVQSSASADRWGETVGVIFDSGAHWAPHYDRIVCVFQDGAEHLIAAADAHDAAVAAHEEEHPFNFGKILERPVAPMPSIEAEAGALIRERGIEGAIATMLHSALSGPLSEREQTIAAHLLAARPVVL